MAYVPASKLIDINALEEFRKKSQWRLSRDSDSVVLTGPKGETTSVDVGAINADKINSNTEKINSLQSDTVTIKNTLTAHGARITTLETDSLEVNRKLTADEADIADLKTNTLTVDSADIRYAAIDDLDAVNASIQSLETTKLSADDADIKYATIQNLSAATGRIDTLESTALTTDTADIRYASITNLNAATARISDLETTALTTDTADIRYATITNLNTEKARIDTLETDALTADTADLRYAAIGDLNAATARIGTLESDMITADQADLKYATIQNLNAANANIQSLQTDKLDATDLTAYQATVTDLLANKADIDLANIGTGVIKTAMIENGAITTALIGTGAVETAQIADGSITDGKIVSLSATKISAGTLDAANIDVVHLNAASITVGQINGTQIANGAIDLDQLSSGVANTISSNTANVTQALNDIGVLQDDVGTATADAQSAKATANSALAKVNEAIQEVDVEYAVGDSSSTAPTTGWSTDSPQWQTGKYIWQRTKVVDGDDNTSYSEPTCIQGAKGQDGQNGQNGENGKDGKDGVSPTITTSKTGTVTTLTITDSTGTSTATINDGVAGSRGTTWYAGTAITGTSTTAAVFSGSGVSSAIVGDHYLNTDTQNVYVCKKKGNASTATWAYEMNIKGSDGTPGTNGTDGKTAYLHVKYSNDGGTTFTGNSGEDAGTYIGTYSDNTQADSTSVSAYTWIKIEGEDGEDGISPTVVASKSGTVTTITITDVNGTRTSTVNDGVDGARGATWYAGTAITGTSTSATIFSGSGVSSAIVGDHYLNTSTQNVYVCAKAGNASTATWKYEQNIKGANGTPGTNGTNGTDGKSAYLHVKYSDDGGTTFTSNSGEDTGSWIGTYTDDVESDSSSVSAYKWVKIEGKDGKDGKDGSRGATWYAGTAITGTATTATKFTGSGVTSAITGDRYLNTSTQNVYVCVTGGDASTATWKYEQNIKGASGTPGTNGTNGTSAYFHVKYSDDGGQTFTSNSGETAGSYIGTYTDDIETDSTSVSAYTWVKIEGTDGKDGSRGATWYAGTKITGTSTTATKFTGSGITSAIAGDHYLNTSTQNVYVCVVGGNASTATWKYEQNIKGATGTPGEKGDPGTNGTNGTDGKTAYLHVKYSDDGGTTFTGNSGEDPGAYIGTYSDNTAADSTSVSKYTWVRIEGLDGEDGVSPIITSSKSGTVTTITITDASGTKTATLNDGINGERGATWYAGTKITGTSTTATVFSGSGITSAIVGDHYLNTSTQNMYVCKKAGNASTATWAYEENIKGETGQAGTNGIDGKTAYFHVKYSNDGGQTFTGNSGEDAGTYIGTYSDNTQADSTSVSKYTWVKIEGEDGADGVSPTVVASKSGTVTTLTITDVNGTRTATVNDGTNGSRGATWYAGTAITGTSTSATIFSGSGVSSAIVGDHYLNTSTQNVYVCAKAGNASTATWKYEQNIKGASGTPGTNGTNGTDGKSAYLHVKYSNDGGTTFTSNSGEDTGSWIGTYTDDQEADSTSVSAYKWVKIEGTDGKDGKDGSRGATWYAGTAITGTSTTATKFTGSGITSAITGDHYLNTSTQNVYVCVTGGNASTATWKYEQNIKGATGTPGTNGTNGSTAYFHVKYSNDGGATFTANSGEDPGTYIGTYSDNTATDSTSVSKYTWVKIEGTDGKDGTRGATWYAGTAITGTSTTATKFTGSGITSAIAGDHYLNTSTQNVYVCVVGGNASTATWKYEQNIKGATGQAGTNGTDGKTAYMHVKYSNDGGATFTSNSGEDPGSYIGTYSDNTAADSTSVSKYTWVRIEGLDGEDGVSPIITSSKSGTVTTITIADASGTKTATLNDGAAGARGATWYAGTKITGTSTTAAVFSGSGISSAIVGDHYLNTSTQNVYVCKKAGNASTATWAYEENIKGETGQAGTNGTNGKTAYFHVKYSNDGGATFTGNSGEDTGTYIGTYSDNNATDSTSVSAYKWVKIEGIDGEDGVSPTITTSKTGSVSTITIVDALGTKRVNINDGVAGARGATWYAGTKITGTSTTATVFSGSGISNAIVGDHYLNTATQNVYVCAKAGAASTATWKYEQNIKGATGATGPTGPDGKTAYFHVKYSNDGGKTFTANSGETAGTYIGTYTDNTAADSTSVSKYTWVKIEGIDGEDGVSITKVEEQYYLSTSDTTQTGGSWSTTQPAWSSGKYIWTRSHITFSNNTTSDTTPVLAKAINSANTTANAANTTANSANTTANSAKTAADNAVLVATTAQTSADKALSSTEIIVGTQTAATGAWTGNASFATLEDGQSIIYWLPFAGSGNATLNLTLSTGLTTGAKNCYYSGATRLTTHYAAGNAIRLTYMKAANVNGTSYEGWWADANQNTDTYDRVRYNWSITAASAITAGQLLVADSNGKYKPLTTASFDVSKPILWAGSAIAASKTGTNNYIAYPNVNVTVTKSGFTGTNLATLYLYGTLSGSTFTPNANLFTTTVPTSMTTDTYIAVGQMMSTTACYLYPEHPMYRYYNGKFQSITQLAYEAFISADTARDKADAAQQTADSASGTANTALQTANGKNKVFHQASAPATGMQTNDTWFDTDDGYKMYRYNGSSWVAEQFNSNAIADAAITNAKIKDATIQSAKIATLDAGKITTGTLAADRIGANSITAAKIATGTITSTQIASGTIKASNIATGSITADLIGAGVISADHLASNSITSDKIVSGAVTAAKIASKTITANEIASNAITADKIASNAVTAAKISAGAVTAVKIESNAVTADKIAAGAVTAAKINVSDLYALGATIGGFVINETSIASADKATNGGIQLNKDGSVDIGDSNSYIRYADGNLDMRVTSLTIGGSGVATAAQLTNMSDTVNSIATAANTTANSALVRADDAAKTATNFLHYDSVYGLVVTQSPVASASAVANITDSNLRITSDSVDVFKGQKRLARYGANVILGDEDASNVLIDPSGGLQVRSGADVLGSFSTSGVGLGVSRDNKPYMNINPEAFSIKQIIQVTDDSGSYPQVLDDDIFSISFNSDVTYGELGTESGDVLTMETGEALGYTEGEAIAQLQFGVENDSRGVGTAVFGEGLEAISRYSFAVGRYNKATGTDLFVVGNGNGDSTRSNALTIDKSGVVTIPGRIVNTATPTGNTDLVNKAYVDNAIKALYKLITGNNYPS